MVNCKKILFQHTLGPSKLVTILNLMAKMLLAGYQVEAARVDAFCANESWWKNPSSASTVNTDHDAAARFPGSDLWLGWKG